MKRNRTGMTLIEVLAMLLLISLGLASVIGLVMWGQRLAAEAMARHTAMSTARSLLYDAHPLLRDDSGWINVESYSLSLPTRVTQTGFCNGYFVERIEEAAVIDAALDNVVRAQVQVRVFSGESGKLLSTAQATILRSGE